MINLEIIEVRRLANGYHLLEIKWPIKSRPFTFTRASVEEKISPYLTPEGPNYVFLVNWFDNNGIILFVLKWPLQKDGSLRMICPEPTLEQVMRLTLGSNKVVQIFKSVEEFEEKVVPISGALS